MNIKKSLLMILAIGILALSACKKEEIAQLSPAEIVTNLIEEIPFSDSLYLLGDEMFLDLYGIKSDILDFKAVYIGTGATCEELVVIETKKKDDLEKVKQAIGARVAGQKESYADYMPEEAAKLDSAVISTRGNIVVLVVSGDNEKAAIAVENALKQQQK